MVLKMLVLEICRVRVEGVGTSVTDRTREELKLPPALSLDECDWSTNTLNLQRLIRYRYSAEKKFTTANKNSKAHTIITK